MRAVSGAARPEPAGRMTRRCLWFVVDTNIPSRDKSADPPASHQLNRTNAPTAITATIQAANISFTGDRSDGVQ